MQGEIERVERDGEGDERQKRGRAWGPNRVGPSGSPFKDQNHFKIKRG